MENTSSLKKKMRILGKPYKHTSAYKMYGSKLQEIPKRSTFWETKIRYVQKYEYVKF